MNRCIDARIPLVFANKGEADADDFVLEESLDWTASTGHAPGCACCAPRNPAGKALARLLVARGRGDIPYFRRVVVHATTESAREALRAALRTDPVASLCFKLN